MELFKLIPIVGHVGTRKNSYTNTNEKTVIIREQYINNYNMPCKLALTNS